MAVSLTLAHSWEGGHLLLGRHLIPASPWRGDRRLPVPIPASCSPRRPGLVCSPGNRGWEVGAGTEGRERRPRGEEKGAHLKGYFLSRLPLLSFSPYYQHARCQTSSLIQLRWEMTYKVQTKNSKWQLIILRGGKEPAPVMGVCFRLSSPRFFFRVEERTPVPFIRKIQTSYLFIRTPSLLSTSHSSSAAYSSSHLSVCCTSLTSAASLFTETHTGLCTSTTTLPQPRRQIELYLAFNLQWTLAAIHPAAGHCPPPPHHNLCLAACDELCSRSQRFYSLPK